MTKFFNKFKKTYFWPTFPIFGAKKFFPENLALSSTTSYRFLAPCQNLEKTNNKIPRKRPERFRHGRKDGQTLFYTTLLATAGGPNMIDLAYTFVHTENIKYMLFSHLD